MNQTNINDHIIIISIIINNINNIINDHIIIKSYNNEEIQGYHKHIVQDNQNLKAKIEEL